MAGGFAYVTAAAPPASGQDESVQRVSTTAPATPLVLSRATSPRSIALDDKFVYWMQSSPNAIYKTTR